jgi:hypothetical protein
MENKKYHSVWTALKSPGSLHVNCQETKHELIPTYSVNHITPGSLYVKCQETKHEIIPTLVHTLLSTEYVLFRV